MSFLNKVGHSNGHNHTAPVAPAIGKVRSSFLDWIISLFSSLFSGPKQPPATMDNLREKVSRTPPRNNVNKAVAPRPLANRSPNKENAAPASAVAQKPAPVKKAEVAEAKPAVAPQEQKPNNIKEINVIKRAEKVLNDLSKNFENLSPEDISKGVKVIGQLQKLPGLQDRDMQGHLMRVKSELLLKLEKPAKEMANSLIRKVIETINGKPKASDKQFLKDVKGFNEIMKACYNYHHLDGLVTQLERKLQPVK